MSEKGTLVNVTREHFLRAAREIGQNGENDTIPYDIDAAFIKDRAEELSQICIELFVTIDAKNEKNAAAYVNELTVGAERLLTPVGSHGFRITTKIHPFWNLYLNGLGLAIAEANEPVRSSRVHSYRLISDPSSFFDQRNSWQSYKEATLQERILAADSCVVIQTDISSFYEQIYHHRLESIIKDLQPAGSTVATQVDRILSKLAAGRSFGLPVGGQCARVLAEVMMTPIDRSLSDAGLIWHRYVDDFTLVCSSQQEGYNALWVLSHALADYGLSLNRSKTTTLSSKHYRDYIIAQTRDDDDDRAALRELDLHFDPYSDAAEEEYEKLRQSFEKIDIQFLLDIEKAKSQPDTFVVAQISRALKFQEPTVAAQLCATLLDPRNLDAFRASWSKIMRGVYSVRANREFEALFDEIDDMLDQIPCRVPHLLSPEANNLHYLRAIRFRRTDARGGFVRQLYDTNRCATIRRACIDCWRHWPDRAAFIRLRNDWQNLGPDEQRMLWLAAGNFDDEGEKARDQLRRSLAQAWRLGFEPAKEPPAKEPPAKEPPAKEPTFATCFEGWAQHGK